MLGCAVYTAVVLLLSATGGVLLLCCTVYLGICTAGKARPPYTSKSFGIGTTTYNSSINHCIGYLVGQEEEREVGELGCQVSGRTNDMYEYVVRLLFALSCLILLMGCDGCDL